MCLSPKSKEDWHREAVGPVVPAYDSSAELCGSLFDVRSIDARKAPIGVSLRFVQRKNHYIIYANSP